jgi:hypothetical protein
MIYSQVDRGDYLKDCPVLARNQVTPQFSSQKAAIMDLQLHRAAICILALFLCVFPQKRLVAHWSFNEGSGDTLHDISGNHCNGHISNAMWGPGKVGSALSFNGTNSYVQIDSIAPFKLQAFSITAWVKPAGAINGSRPVFSNQSISPMDTLYGTSFKLYGGKVWHYETISSSPNYLCGCPDGVYIDTGAWHFIVAVCPNPPTDSIYGGSGHDSLFNQTNCGPDPHVLAYTNVRPLIGSNFNNPNDTFGNFNGKIDDLRIYNYALTYAEIRALYTFVYAVPTSNNTRPTFSWIDIAGPYCLFVARDSLFRQQLLKISTSDTTYTPASDLPQGKIWWKLGYNLPDTIWTISLKFQVLPPNYVIVPDNYATIKEALNQDSVIRIRGKITQNTSVKKNCEISSLDSLVPDTIIGSFSISASNVSFKNLVLKGASGTSGAGGCAPQGQPCPAAGSGANGQIALTITNSDVTLVRCDVAGGAGGNAGAGSVAPICMAPCSCGKPGNGAPAFQITHSKVQVEYGAIHGSTGGDLGWNCSGNKGAAGIGGNALDTSRVTINQATADSFFVDPTSLVTIIPSTSAMQLNAPKTGMVKNRFHKQVMILKSGAPILVYDALGRKVLINYHKGSSKVQFLVTENSKIGN